MCSDPNADKSIKADAICHGNYQDGSCFSSALSELCINRNSDTVLKIRDRDTERETEKENTYLNKLCKH